MDTPTVGGGSQRDETLMKEVAAEHIMQFFEYAHLPEKLQLVSMEFRKLADGIIANIPRNPERTVALLKLFEAKDAAVRAMLAK